MKVFAHINTAGAFWLLPDHLRSIRDVANASGAIVERLGYDGFGNINSIKDGNGNLIADAEYVGRYRFTGREYDVETGLQYSRARYYDATIGRWINQDPLGFDAGDSNLYRYVNNRPTTATDPSGQLERANSDRPSTLFIRAMVLGKEEAIGTIKATEMSTFLRYTYNAAWPIVQWHPTGRYDAVPKGLDWHTGEAIGEVRQRGYIVNTYKLEGSTLTLSVGSIDPDAPARNRSSGVVHLSDSEMERSQRVAEDQREALRALFDDRTIRNPEEGRRRLLAWMEQAKTLGLSALNKFFKTLTNWLDKIANYFHSRSSNGRTEGYNHGLRAILWRAYGMTNFQNFRLRVLHCFGVPTI